MVFGGGKVIKVRQGHKDGDVMVASVSLIKRGGDTYLSLALSLSLPEMKLLRE